MARLPALAALAACLALSACQHASDPAPAASVAVADPTPESAQYPADPAFTFAQARTACDQAQVESIVVIRESPTAKPYDPESADGQALDYCRRSWADTPVAIRSALQQLRDYHAQAARRLGLPVASLLEKKIRIELYPGIMGALSSYFDPTSSLILLGTPTRWTESARWRLDRGVYLHELGHALSFVPRPGLPSGLPVAAISPFVTEGFADLLSHSITHQLVESFELSGCEGRIRASTRFETFDFAADFFRREYSTRKLQSCCRYFQSHGKAPSADRVQACKQIEEAAKSFKALDLKTRFTPELYLATPQAFDGHQLGIPLNSFFNALEHDTGVDALKLLLETVRRLDSQQTDAQVCQHPYADGFLPGISFPALNAYQVFAGLRDGMPAESRDRFDAVWKRISMDTVLKITQSSQAGDARSFAGYQMVLQNVPLFRAADRDKFLYPQLLWNGCYASYPDKYLTIDGVCAPRCEKRPADTVDPSEFTLVPQARDTQFLTATDDLPNRATQSFHYAGKGLNADIVDGKATTEIFVDGANAAYLYAGLALKETVIGPGITRKAGTYLACDKHGEQYRCAVAVNADGKGDAYVARAETRSEPDPTNHAVQPWFSYALNIYPYSTEPAVYVGTFQLFGRDAQVLIRMANLDLPTMTTAYLSGAAGGDARGYCSLPITGAEPVRDATCVFGLINPVSGGAYDKEPAFTHAQAGSGRAAFRFR